MFARVDQRVMFTEVPAYSSPCEMPQAAASGVSDGALNCGHREQVRFG
jgi:hypothetical protein